MTKPTFGTTMSLLEGAYPNQKTTDGDAERLKLYKGMLADIPAGLLHLATQMHLAESNFFPSVAELRKNAAEIAMGQIPSATEAWGEVMAKITDKKFDSANPITKRLVKSIGWWSIQKSTLMAAERKVFMEGYNALAIQEKRLMIMPPEVRDALPAVNRLQLLSKSPAQMEAEIIEQAHKQLEAKNE